jgi:hypothetical protein
MNDKPQAPTGAAGGDDPTIAANPIPGTLLSNTQLFELFVTRIVQQVDTHMAERQSRSAQRFSIIVAIVTALFAVLAGAIFSYFDTLIDSRFRAQESQMQSALVAAVTDTVTARTQAQIAEQMVAFADKSNEFFVKERLYLEFVVAVNTMEVKQTTDLSDIRAVVDLLHRIAAVEELQQKAGFDRLLVKVFDELDGFADRGVDRYIDELEPKFRQRLRAEAATAKIMVFHYFRVLMSSPDAPNDWDAAMLERFEIYADASIFHNELGRASALRMMMAYGRNGFEPTPVVDNLILQASDFKSGERDYIKDIVDYYAEEEADDLIKRRVAPFRTAYAAQLPKGGD